MDLLKNHYEKVVLSITLLALAATAAWLYAANQRAQTTMSEAETTLPPVKQMKPVSVEQYRTNLAKVKSPPTVNLTEGHNVFNPVTWKIRPDGEILKIQTGNEEGPAALKVLKLKPLNLVISLDRPGAGSATFSITREAAANPFERRRVQRYVSPTNPRNEFFTLVEARPADAPTEWVLELASGEREKITVSQQQPFSRVEGYAVDLRYDPENRTFLDLREGSTIVLGGEAYKIVAISKNDVRLAAISTGKQFIIKVQN